MRNSLFGAAGILISVLLFSSPPVAKAQEVTVEIPFTVEFYYKIKWGFFDEWLELYKKNHYPILKRFQEQGRILEMNAVFPANHAGEADRWDMRFTVVYRNAIDAHDFGLDTSDILEEFYPDQELFKKEEQRRFELMEEHTDIPVIFYDLSEWGKK